MAPPPAPTSLAVPHVHPPASLTKAPGDEATEEKKAGAVSLGTLAAPLPPSSPDDKGEEATPALPAAAPSSCRPAPRPYVAVPEGHMSMDFPFAKFDDAIYPFLYDAGLAMENRRQLLINTYWALEAATPSVPRSKEGLYTLAGVT